MAHEELQQYRPAPLGRAERKMLTCSEDAYDKLRKIANEMGAPMSKTIGALIYFYLDTEFEENNEKTD